MTAAVINVTAESIPTTENETEPIINLEESISYEEESISYDENITEESVENTYTEELVLETAGTIQEEIQEETSSIVPETIKQDTESTIELSHIEEPIEKAADEYLVIWNTLKSYNYSDFVIAGIIGNIVQETGNLVTNWKTYQNSLCGWGDSRLNDLYSLYGSSPTVEQQAKYIHFELTGTEGVKRQVTENEYNSLINASSVDEATRIFCYRFERPGIPSISKRIQFAQEVYNYFTSIDR